MNRIVLFLESPVIDGLGALRGNVHQQSPAKGHVQELVPAADCQKRLALQKHFLDHPQLPQIAVMVVTASCLTQ